VYISGIRAGVRAAKASEGQMNTAWRTRFVLLTGAAVAALSGATAAYADSIETVVVTAERRSEAVFDVPATVTAISGEKLQNLGVTDMKSIIAMVPNAVLPDDSENFETFINIRGVRQADINAEPNFGLYRNGIFAGGERGNLGAQVDLARVEVLSGPQSGLYGRDAVGGVVNVVYATPDFNGLKGYITGSYGNYDKATVQGAVNVPITDNAALRVVGWLENQNEGQLFNPTLNLYIDKYRDVGGRISGRWDTTSQLSTVWTAEIEDKDGPSFTAYAPAPLGAVFGVQCCGLPVEPAETLKTIRHDTADREHWSQVYFSQDSTYDTGTWAGSVELQLAYRNYHLNLQEDQDHTPFGPDSSPMVLKQVQYRQESLNNFYGQLLWKSPDDQPLTWIAGVDYFDETFNFSRVFAGTVNFNLLNTPAFGPGFTYGNLLCSFLMAPYDGGCESFTSGSYTAPGLPGAGAGQFPYTFPNIGDQSGGNAFGAPGSGIHTTSISGFVSATYHVDDALSVTGNLRWDQSRKHLVYIQGAVSGYGETALGASYLTPLFGQIFVPYTDRETDVFVNVAPSVTVQYKMSDQVNLYATWATGFRAGGFNLGTSTPAYLPYKPEKDQNFELGAKTVWFDGTLAVNADVFYMRQSDLVEPQTDTTVPSFLGLYYLANVGAARTIGAELTAAWQATDWLGLGTSIGYMDDHFTSGTTHGVSVKGQEIPLTRNWTINNTATISYPLTSDVNLVGDADWRLEFGGWLPASVSNLATTKYKSFNDLDFDLGVAFGQTRITGFMHNAFDDVIPQFQYSDGVVNVNQGRTYGIRIQQNF
jgi:iron complex outermembrane recepter protein